MNKEKKSSKKRIAVIRVRGKVHVRGSIEDTMKLLNLTRINHCVVIDNRDQYKGMIKKVKDYVTWGEIDKNIFAKLIEKRGRLYGKKGIDDDYIAKNTKYKSIDEFSKEFINFNSELSIILGLNPVFRLKPPKKGYERKGIKKPYSLGGALGYRGEKINELLNKMI